MHDIINIDKQVGLTPLEALESLRKSQPELENQPITYAGRLDPIASGVLLLLKGEAIKDKESFLKLPKTYLVRILIGFISDSFDILGLPEKTSDQIFEETTISHELNSFIGEKMFDIPIYSSVPVQGKSLQQWAREGRIKEIKIPQRIFSISEINLSKVYSIQGKTLADEIINTINKVSGDFRQALILSSWEKLIQEKDYQILEAEIKCAGGTYIRSIADQLGKNLKSGAVVLSLRRTAVGEYKIENSIKL